MPILEGILTTPIAVGFAQGAVATTPLGPFGGLASGDSLVSVHEISDDLVTNDDVTADATISGEGEITLGTVDSSGNAVVAVWKKAV